MQGYNKYYPPDFDGKTSLNKLAGKHGLGNRARKLSQNILIVRFELPFDVWCEGCENLIAQGTRFNAEKKRAGEYYSTPIFTFGLKCARCSHGFEIRTDPKNTQYVIVSGARKKSTDFDGEKIGAIKVDSLLYSGANSSTKSTDSFAIVERAIHKSKQERKSRRRLAELQKLSSERWSDPYTKNQQLRKHFRENKKTQEDEQSKNDTLAYKIAKISQLRKAANKSNQN
ncbi:CWC16 protein [Lipomyces japonicus]|uniref:CWC16 protein n=1 Tax=Lipomyces japonicus TaxID=56871 RepID=UPI0034CDE295